MMTICVAALCVTTAVAVAALVGNRNLMRANRRLEAALKEARREAGFIAAEHARLLKTLRRSTDDADSKD